MLAQIVSTGGAIGTLAFVVLAMLKGWLVPGSVHDQLIRDRDDWKEIALASVNGTEKAISLAERRRADAGRGLGRG